MISAKFANDNKTILIIYINTTQTTISIININDKTEWRYIDLRMVL